MSHYILDVSSVGVCRPECNCMIAVKFTADSYIHVHIGDDVKDDRNSETYHHKYSC